MLCLYYQSKGGIRGKHYELPWKPAVQRGWPADQVKVVGFVDSQSFVDVTVGVDVCRHGAVQRQAAGGGGACRSPAATPITLLDKNQTEEWPFNFKKND